MKKKKEEVNKQKNEEKIKIYAGKVYIKGQVVDIRV